MTGSYALRAGQANFWYERAMWLVGVVGLLALIGAPLIALYGRTRRALVWACAHGAAIVATVVTIWALPLALAIPIAALVDAIRLVVRGRPAKLDWIFAAAVLAIPAATAALLSLALRAFYIPSAGMEPTLRAGDHVFVNRLGGWSRGDVIVFVAPDGRDFVKRAVAVGGDVIAVKDGVVWLNGKAMPTTKRGDASFWNQDEMSGAWEEREVVAYDEEIDGHTHRMFRDPDPQRRNDHDFPQADDRYGIGRCEDAVGSRMADMRGRAVSSPALVTVPGGCRVPDGTVFVLGDNRDDSSDSRVWGPVAVDQVHGAVWRIWWPAAHDRDWSRIGAID